ncbi:hypothetical protein J6590_078633 [Homalodisca vitripennis]|nr:hypothetical protein J6590_078633 [Homalodisca vitripennis]
MDTPSTTVNKFSCDTREICRLSRSLRRSNKEKTHIGFPCDHIAVKRAKLRTRASLLDSADVRYGPYVRTVGQIRFPSFLHTNKLHRDCVRASNSWIGLARTFAGVGTASCRDPRGRIRALISKSCSPGRRGGQLWTSLSSQSRQGVTHSWLGKNLTNSNSHLTQQTRPIELPLNLRISKFAVRDVPLLNISKADRLQVVFAVADYDLQQKKSETYITQPEGTTDLGARYDSALAHCNVYGCSVSPNRPYSAIMAGLSPCNSQSAATRHPQSASVSGSHPDPPTLQRPRNVVKVTKLTLKKLFSKN